MRVLIYSVILLIVTAISGMFLFEHTKEEREKSEKEERRIGNLGLLLYILFFWAITAALLFFVFLILTAVWLFFGTSLFFMAGGKHERYAAAVFDTIPFAGWSVLFVVLFFFLLMGWVMFRRTQIGRALLSEASEIITHILNRFCFLFLMLLQLCPFLSELSYRKRKEINEARSAKACPRRHTAEFGAYTFRETLPDTYGVFLRRLSRFKTVDEKIGFAYGTISRLYQRTETKIRMSDTPREMERKVTRAFVVSEEDAASVRAIIEKVKFRDTAMEETEKAQLLEKLCGFVKRML